jgi:hypothetical protein
LPDQHDEDDTTRATARLPGLEIEIVHRRLPQHDAELISINLQAMPSFEAFARFVETGNPFAFWAQTAQMAWLPWLEAARTLMLSWNVAPVPPKLGPETTAGPRLGARRGAT